MRATLLIIAIISIIQTGNAAVDFTEMLPPDRLTTSAKSAVEAAPAWLRNDLEDNFQRMDGSFQDIYAAMIINPSEARFRDEIAFCVANIGVANLQDPDFIPDLVEENAFFVYEHDQYLDYVRLVDVGDPDTDDDYYTTTYYILEEGGVPLEHALPTEIYYWFIVHPKIEDEWAMYINPDAVGDIPAAPPTGVFWRDWLFNYTEEKPESDDFYPTLKDRMAGVETMWGDTSVGAIGAVGAWIRETLSFTSGNERPHQPVRIYKLHMGRCGEYQDYTTAASRACLIPCLNTEAIGEDHVWNEFWHLRWIHWEPVNGDGYINDPMVYENGWGKMFSGVFDVAGDGWTWDVIDRYSSGYCTVNATVLDANGDPVDSARLALKNVGYPGCYGFAGSDGQISAIYGDGIPCKAKISSDLGKFPDGSATYDIAAITEDGATYSWIAQYPEATLPSIPWKTVISEKTSPYRLDIQFTVIDEILAGYYAYDKTNIFTRPVDGGSIDVFIVDSYNYDRFRNDASFNAFEVHPLASSGSIQFILPYFDTWYVVLTARRKLANEQNVSVTVNLQEQQNSNWITSATVSGNLSLLPGDDYSASVAAGGTLGTRITMPSNVFHPGDDCWCYVYVSNPDLSATGTDIPLFVILDVYGQFFFAPEFNGFSFYTIDDLHAAESFMFEVLPVFTWPQNAGNISGIFWYAAMTNSAVTELIGTLDTFEFGWED
ncbi:hypothetical protein JW823_10465 [bacterium]|nr:hypothetical protein [candidate division CSSED10-310 bacterium]